MKKSAKQIQREVEDFLREASNRGPFYYLSYREALQRAKRLAMQTNSKIRIAAGMDDRAPGRVEYAVAKAGDVPSGFTIVASADPAGNVEASGARHHRMMERRSS